MIDYIIWAEKSYATYYKSFENSSDARHWVINHLDLSENWHIDKIKKD